MPFQFLCDSAGCLITLFYSTWVSKCHYFEKKWLKMWIVILQSQGGGNFQQWIIELFLQNNRNLEQPLYRVCIL